MLRGTHCSKLAPLPVVSRGGLNTGVELYSVNLSTAVGANWGNDRPAGNVFLPQADLFALPFHQRRLDSVLRFGVLQHTPDPALAVGRLVGYVELGGQIFLDIYKRTWKSAFDTND